MFSRYERRLIDRKYFVIIQEADDYIEIKSRNTKHCWIIHKHKFDDKKKIYLYHKHTIKEKYYHQHYMTYTVKQAVNNIKEHDKYILRVMYN